jgi:uncharacterized protein (UPF0335 family)
MSAQAGHNSAATKDELLGYAQRIERLKDEKKNATLEYDDAIKEVWAEAKGRGFDKKALNEVLRMRAMSDEQRQLVEFYLDVAEVFQ